MVPDTSFNLSYTSLTSREARQAILDTRVSDPDFYAELMAAHLPLPASDVAEEDLGDNQLTEDDVPDISVSELEQAIMQSETLSDVDDFLCSHNALDEPSDSSAADSAIPSPGIGIPNNAPAATGFASTARRSQRNRRAPIRFTSSK